MHFSAIKFLVCLINHNYFQLCVTETLAWQSAKPEIPMSLYGVIITVDLLF